VAVVEEGSCGCALLRQALAYRLMGNQFHKVLKARRAKLSRLIATSTAIILSSIAATP